MKCPKCNGRGTVGYYHIDHFVDIECDRCHGSGEVQMTNEEWFCTLPTDEKARVLVDNKLFFRMLDYDGFIEWLKEKHHAN